MLGIFNKTPKEWLHSFGTRKYLFPSEEGALDKLWNLIYQICLVDKKDPAKTVRETVLIPQIASVVISTPDGKGEVPVFDKKSAEMIAKYLILTFDISLKEMKRWF